MRAIRKLRDEWTCALCGRPCPDQLKPHRGACQCELATARGLGDMVADGLAAAGITKDRAQAVAAAVGIKDCGCKKRQDALNAAGRWLGIGTPPPPKSGPTG
jgi:hypothetical protein